jgi:hypothetical protein
MWEVVADTGGPSSDFDFLLVRDFPSPVPVPDAVDTVRRFLLRHPTVRTSIAAKPGTGSPRQHVRGSGVLAVPVLKSDRPGWDRLRALVPGTTADQPCSPLVLVDHGLASCVAVRVSHLITDATGKRLLEHDLLDGADPAGRAETLSPVDLATFEASVAGQRVQQRATGFAAKVYAEAPASMWPQHRRPPERPRFWYGELRSARLAAAMATLGRDRSLNRVGVLAGALSTVTAGACGLGSTLMHTISANRFDPAWRKYSGTLSQEAVLHVPVEKTITDTMRAASAQSMQALFVARYSPTAMAAVRREAEGSRGVSFDKHGSAVVLNVLPDRAAGTSALDPRPGFVWTGSTDQEHLGFYLDAYQQGDEFTLAIRADTALLAPQDIQRRVLELESLVVSAGR